MSEKLSVKETISMNQNSKNVDDTFPLVFSRKRTFGRTATITELELNITLMNIRCVRKSTKNWKLFHWFNSHFLRLPNVKIVLIF